MPDVIQLAMVDDHPFFRDGVRRALRKARDVALVAEGASAADACRIAREQQPDIMLLDIAMPGNGIDAARAIAASTPLVKIIMLTGSDDDEHAAAALAAGAIGFLLKGADSVELLKAVRTVYAGRPYVTQALSSRMLVQAVRTSRPNDAAKHSDLSVREQQILAYAVQGKTNLEIANELGLALPTVKNYMSRIFEKLRVRNRAEAIVASVKGK